MRRLDAKRNNAWTVTAQELWRNHFLNGHSPCSYLSHLSLSCRRSANSSITNKNRQVSVHFILCLSLTAVTTAQTSFVWLFPSSSPTWGHYRYFFVPNLHCCPSELLAKRLRMKCLNAVMQYSCKMLQVGFSCAL